MSWTLVAALVTRTAVARAAVPRRYPTGSTTDVVTFPFDDAHLLARGHHNAGAAWVTPNTPRGASVPLLIYLHGLNRDRILRRWMHGSAWDMRTIVGPMVMDGLVGPMAVAVPATTGDSAQSDGTIYPRFDVAAFVDATDRALSTQGYHVDRAHVIFIAHSASGCAMRNGLFAGVGSPAVETIFDLDCCMTANFASVLANAPANQRVIMAYQDYMWARDYNGFLHTFRRITAQRGLPADMRVIDYYDLKGEDVHNGIVPIALRKWMPILVPPGRPISVSSETAQPVNTSTSSSTDAGAVQSARDGGSTALSANSDASISLDAR